MQRCILTKFFQLQSLGVFGLCQIHSFYDYLRANMTKENFNTIIRAFTITVATIISIGLAVLTLSGKVAPWTGRFYSLLDPSYAKNNIPIIGNVKLLSIRFSFCTLGGASKLFVYKQSSASLEIRKKKSNFYRFSTSIFHKRCSLRSQIANYGFCNSIFSK